jgi:hypothetical protein
VWSALGGELKPSLDLVVTAPIDLDRASTTAAPVLEDPRFDFGRGDGDGHESRRRRSPSGATHDPALEPAVASETIVAGRDSGPGRIFRIRGSSDPVPPDPDDA